MKVTREQAAANREKIVEVASILFRKHGFDGIGVADIMKAAGLTHGGFYGQFASKEELAAEACARCHADPWTAWLEAPRQSHQRLSLRGAWFRRRAPAAIRAARLHGARPREDRSAQERRAGALG